MKKSILLFILLIAVISTNKAQIINCNDFCVSNITMDTALAGFMNVTIINADTNKVNYPIVRVVTHLAGIYDTVANKTGQYFLFEQPAHDTLIHHIPTTLTSVPVGFTCIVYLTTYISDSTNYTCSYNYPMDCTSSLGIDNLIAFNNKLNIFPNPATNNITISVCDLHHKQAIINLYDSYGQVVKTYITTNDQLTIGREGLANGIYFVSAFINNKRLTSKLIIN